MNPNTLPPLSEFSHSTDLQIRFNDIDILGHLNNTVYFSFYDTGKAYFFQHLLGDRLDWRRVETVIANVDCAYISPIYFGETLELWTRCAGVYDKSFKLQQVIVEKGTREIKSCAETIMVSFDPDSKTSVPVPQYWREALERSMRRG